MAANVPPLPQSRLLNTIVLEVVTMFRPDILQYAALIILCYFEICGKLVRHEMAVNAPQLP